MNNGIIQQLGSPESIYNEPINAFVADFIGESNIFTGIMNSDCYVTVFNHGLKCVDKGFTSNESVDVVVRPEDVELILPNENSLIGIVTDCIFKGVHYETCVEVNGVEWVVHNTNSHIIGSSVGIYVKPDNIHIMKKVVGP
jgi:spermidine/putrescine transport system ATP-binding protein